MNWTNKEICEESVSMPLRLVESNEVLGGTAMIQGVGSYLPVDIA
jgi:hypothetical protein